MPARVPRKLRMTFFSSDESTGHRVFSPFFKFSVGCPPCTSATSMYCTRVHVFNQACSIK